MTTFKDLKEGDKFIIKNDNYAIGGKPMRYEYKCKAKGIWCAVELDGIHANLQWLHRYTDCEVILL